MEFGTTLFPLETPKKRACVYEDAMNRYPCMMLSINKSLKCETTLLHDAPLQCKSNINNIYCARTKASNIILSCIEFHFFFQTNF